MRLKSLLLGVLVLALAATASAQAKLSGQNQCAKADPQYSAPIGDRPDHVMLLAKGKCTWSAGEIGGVKIKEDETTTVTEVSGSSGSDRGHVVVSLDDGDKAFVRFEGKSTMKDKMPADGNGTWTFTGGTGKLKGIKGKGTYKGKWNADGTSAFDIEGEYTLAAAKTKSESKPKAAK